MPSDNLNLLSAHTFIGAAGTFLIALAMLLAFPQAAHAAITLIEPPNNLGLVGYWSFNEGTGTVATDFSAKGNQGTLANSPSWVNGKRGKALNFVSANSQYVDAGNATSLQITGSLTVSAWVNISAIQAGGVDDNWVGKIDFNIPEYSWLLKGTEDCGVETVGFFVSGNADASNSAQRCGTTELKTNTWYHVVGVYTAGGTPTVQVYVNGVLENGTLNGTPPALLFNSSNQVIIGSVFEESGFSDGSIDEVRIYNRALGATEIAALARAGATKFTTSSVNLQEGSTLANGLDGHWTFDGPDVTATVTDRSGNGNHGYFLNGATSSAKVQGKLGQALRFDGGGNSVFVSNGFGGSPTDVSVALWAKFDEPVSGRDDIINAADDTIILFLGFDDQLRGSFYEGGFSWVDTLASTVIEADRWYHIVYTFNDAANSQRIYVDGVEAGNSSSASSISWEGTATYIGAGFTGSSAWVDGTLDDVRFYNRALSPAEVKQLYKLGAVTVIP